MSAVYDTPHPSSMSAALTDLFRRLLAEMDTHQSVEWDATESTIDSAGYHDQSILDKELEHIFRRFPLCLGHADQLREPGSMIARDLLGLPLLLVRDRHGEINVFLNVCTTVARA